MEIGDICPECGDCLLVDDITNTGKWLLCDECGYTEETKQPDNTAELEALRKDISSKLTKVAATLLKSTMSDIDDDYPKRFPKYVLRDIENHNEVLRVNAIELTNLRIAIDKAMQGEATE